MGPHQRFTRPPIIDTVRAISSEQSLTICTYRSSSGQTSLSKPHSRSVENGSAGFIAFTIMEKELFRQLAQPPMGSCTP